MANKETYPFRDIDDLKAVYKFLLKNNYVREAHMLVIGCNVALRISDLLQLKFEDVEKSRYTITEKKTSKKKTLKFNGVVMEHVEKLGAWYMSNNYEPKFLFEATARNTLNRPRKPVTSGWVNKRLQEAARARDIDYPIGTHSMRKTWGYTSYNNGMKIEQIMKTLNHAAPSTTLAYIGIMQEDIEQGYMDTEIRI